MIMPELDNIFDPELDLDNILDEPANSAEPSTEIDTLFLDEPSTEKIEESVLNDYLKSKGVENSKVTIVDENNEEKEINFYELSKSEQLEILHSISQEEQNSDLDESEVELINHLRTNNLSIDDFLENYKQSIIEELGIEPTHNYDIDAYDDNELFVLDLKNKYNLSEEQLVKELEKELQDETIFKTKVDILRTEYKKLEDQYNKAQEEEAENQRAEQYEKFSETMVDVALKTPEFYGIELEDDEKNEVLSFLLDLDDNGTSEFYKSLNDPKKLYEAAWFLRYGKESFDALKNAYESEITKLKKVDKTIVVHKKNDDTNKQNSIYDLNF